MKTFFSAILTILLYSTPSHAIDSAGDDEDAPSKKVSIDPVYVYITGIRDGIYVESVRQGDVKRTLCIGNLNPQRIKHEIDGNLSHYYDKKTSARLAIASAINSLCKPVSKSWLIK